MGDTKWTPGPWRVISSGRHVVSDDAPGYVVIVRTGLDHSEGDEMPDTIERWEADAHLIAAAPELYAALEGIIEYTRACEALLNASESGHCINAKAALAKARGES